MAKVAEEVQIPEADKRALVRRDHLNPHGVLGCHPTRVAGVDGSIVRVLHPEAVSVEIVLRTGQAIPLANLGEGFFGAFAEGLQPQDGYLVRERFHDGNEHQAEDPYRFLPTLGDIDLHLFGEGQHRRLWDVFGSHERVVDGISGTSFAVWAPNARGVAVIGDFCHWDARIYPMRQIGSSGVFELFLPGVGIGALYKFDIVARDGAVRRKTDPFAFAMEVPPATASRVFSSRYQFGDEAWMEERLGRDYAHEPFLVYELHLGSWRRDPTDPTRLPRYREIARPLAEHVRRLGFTHVELMPLAEHAFYASWGYQVTGFYAPTARYGNPDDLRFFVDTLHAHGIGVLLDWVPAHFPDDAFALACFDGTALYEHEDPRLGRHPDWGTVIFNYGRNEVRNFLVANALYWIQEFHIDGLRIDAVASMLYLDYSRRSGEWLPNREGGRENLEAIEFLRDLDAAVRECAPGAATIAEESTAWSGVTAPTEWGGLGFTLKWNMGWMHDTLGYFRADPVFRRFHHEQLTFAMLYEYSERFLMPLSHDEVVHGKRSLLDKMPGDAWQKFANLRALLLYQYTRPGKVLLFMGAEVAPWDEWDHDVGLDWSLLKDPARAAHLRFVEELGGLYRERPCFWRSDPGPESFEWLVAEDCEQSVFAYLRRSGDDVAMVVLNLTPVPRDGYRLGCPLGGWWRERLSTDEERFGGSLVETPKRHEAHVEAAHGREQSLVLRLPPLGGIVLVPDSDGGP